LELRFAQQKQVGSERIGQHAIVQLAASKVADDLKTNGPCRRNVHGVSG
jgi:hypothetical protein